MNDPVPRRRVTPAARMLGLLIYLFVVAVLLLAITGAGVAIVRMIRAIT